MSFFPVASDSYRITSTFGSHHGFDIAVPTGTAAISTVGGIVEQVRFVRRSDGSPSYGNLIVVRDDAGRRHYYAHLSAFNVREGQRVGAGHTLGYTGATGRATGPHLHYEVRDRAGRQIDPSSLWGDRKAAASSGGGYQLKEIREASPYRSMLPTLAEYSMQADGDVLDSAWAHVQQRVSEALNVDVEETLHGN